MPKLGVNIDHIATLRQARGEYEPNVVSAAQICQKAGADSIVCHLREDRRHIQDNDVKELRKIIKRNLTLELSLNKNIIDFACKIKPDIAVIVPERRQEITTEGGLDIIKQSKRTAQAIKKLKNAGIAVSVFIDPSKKQIQQAHKLNTDYIEIHTGTYANAKTRIQKQRELKKIRSMVKLGQSLGLTVNAGHGLKYHDTLAIAKIPGIYELNIGHSIISHSITHGLKKSVQEMKKIVSLKV